MNGKIEDYKILAKELRKDILSMIYRTKSPHIGSSFSMVELLIILYYEILRVNPKDPLNKNRDRFLLSKGHGCATLFAVLARKGFLKKEELINFAQDGDYLGQHPNMSVGKGIEITSGSLGHGLSIGAGMALAGKHDKSDHKTFVFLGDGELNEGSIWEGALFASQHKLDNLIVIIDRNKLQALGSGSDILNMEPLLDKWTSFGWQTKEIQGHDFQEIFETFNSIPFKKDKPNCVIAETIKGKGVSFMENDFKWHDKCPDEKEYDKALKEIDSAV
jgi:transketolase